ncbi:glycoside hydrolase [Paramesorhizobium deserti]|uniref:glycoside hydrolase n=1 Tax=Paramesorhizobium deserti TaxID=1494590 RepID=UPI00190FF758|nr:glycoside hydrolase [Paramesorhizobium deserti]
MEPETLAIMAQPAGTSAVDVSVGGPLHSVAGLEADPDHASWRWDDGAYTISLHLNGDDLSLSIAAKQAGSLPILHQPATAMGKGLIFPLAEGSYIPADDRIWRDFLLDHMSEFNTSQDISLPLWGLDHGTFSLSWLLTNPLNNAARFMLDGDGLALLLDHDFTTLDPGSPMTMILHLGDSNPLAGAQRYRAWLITEGKYQTLKDKIAVEPQAAKLIGAPHTYLWDGGLLSTGDVKDWQRLLSTLTGEDRLAADLRGNFDAEARATLNEAKGKPDHYQQRVLVRAFNDALDALARKSWQTAAPDMELLARRYGELRSEVVEAFGDALDPDPARWGGGISISTIKKFQDAGLKHLWVGLGEGWEGGLWHPEAVRAGVDAGYLVAPYDSYDTALKQGDNPSWTAAHLGDAAYRDCAITHKDGSLQAGFQKRGHYTRPDCVRPLMEERMWSILSVVPFNSWFLDVYATGMVFDSYPPGRPMSQAENVAGNVASMRWISETLKLPLGSEDGNATTAEGVLFAHGMQTPVIGWGDKDMQKDKSSPYHLGIWYPEEQPQIFFKEVPVKEPYRTVHFDPRTRLPLYQAVFHGSIITTHHWLFDSLKLTNVRAENELTQLLYNVAPLYNLSLDTLDNRLSDIKRQDSFFRPLHQRLATQPLVDFRWLTKDRLVQQTTFEDRTRLIANFSRKPYRHHGIVLQARSIAAYPAGGEKPAIYEVDAPKKHP